MSMTRIPAPTPLIPLPADTLVCYQYATKAGLVTVAGRKGPAINPGQNAGFELLSETGEHVANVTRYANVIVMEGPRTTTQIGA